jgi:pimeloyl-ACP methyl ester carboxylesterase
MNNDSSVNQIRERRAYADVEVGQIHYREAGEGPVLILLHKTPASSTMFSRVLPLLAMKCRVIAVDTPGFGMSDQLPEKPGSNLSGYRNAIVEFMDVLEIPAAHLLGHSTGAALAFEIAAHHPDRTRSLIVATSPAVATEAERDELMAEIHSGVSPRWVEPVELDGVGDFLEEYPLAPLRSLLTDGDPDQFLVQLVAYLQALPHYWWIAEGVLAVPGSYELFDRINCPTLVLNTARGLNRQTTLRVHQSLSGSRYVELPGDTEVTMDFPVEFSDAVLSFLEECMPEVGLANG